MFLARLGGSRFCLPDRQAGRAPSTPNGVMQGFSGTYTVL